MERLITLFCCLIISQLSPAVSRHALNRGRIDVSQEARDSTMVSYKRSALNFGFMITCAVGRSPLDYNGYGCFCGLGGGGTPVDDTDRCCEIHDKCYTDVQNSGSCPFDAAIYLISYSRKECYGCEPESYYWFYGECRHALCMCDSEAVQCFKNAEFNDSFKYYSQDKC